MNRLKRTIPYSEQIKDADEYLAILIKIGLLIHIIFKLYKKTPKSSIFVVTYIVYILLSFLLWLFCITPKYSDFTTDAVLLTVAVSGSLGVLALLSFYFRNLFKYRNALVFLFCSVNFVVSTSWFGKDLFDVIFNTGYQPFWAWVYGFTADIIGSCVALYILIKMIKDG
ncbi:MAG: hypothetical protein IMY67_12190 [Bacteroidetes bacterium]|nr:hypothetical protein [Bacteroidota bacterium]